MSNGKETNRDSSTRKWLILLNNPKLKGYTHDKIKEVLGTFKGISYWCMCDEIGLESKLPHTHIFLYSNSPIKFSTMKKKFEGGHFDVARGTCIQNQDYVRKEGKWAKDKKKDTNLPYTFEEWGTMPLERQGHRSDLEDVLDMIKSGKTDIEIIEEIPSQVWNIDKLEGIRQRYLARQFDNIFRNVEVTYIYGATRLGKTRYVMDKYGYRNVCRVYNYIKNPFDNYNGQDVILFDEFRSSFNVADMLTYIDGHPIQFPCRYRDKQACYTKIYIISNIPLEKQYVDIQRTEFGTWQAFLARIHYVCEFIGKNFSVPLTMSEWLDKHPASLIEPVSPINKSVDRMNYWDWQKEQNILARGKKK